MIDVSGARRKMLLQNLEVLGEKLLQNLEVLVSKRPLTMRGGGLDFSGLESDGTQQ